MDRTSRTQSGSPPPAPGKPPAVLWTSSDGDGLASRWLLVLRSGVLGPRGEATVWQISLRPHLRVLEVNRPDDWAALLRRYPGPVVYGFLQPDWDRAVAAFDGVHLTVEGLLTVQAVRIAVERGTGMLWGWDAECTAWLRWPARSVRLKADVPSL